MISDFVELSLFRAFAARGESYAPARGPKGDPAASDLGRLILGAHYFGAHDPVSFWDAMRPEDVAEQLFTIRDDGFDHIVLLIPWHAFFTDMTSGELAPFYRDRLRVILNVAACMGMKVMGRIFYGQCAAARRPGEEHRRQFALLEQNATSPWMESQARAIAEETSRSPAWAGAFVTWEDFWACFEGPPHWKADGRVKVARTSGFSDWIKANDLIEQAEALGLEKEAKTWRVPSHQTQGMRLWVAFFDQVIRKRVLAPVAKAFPLIGIEPRVDAYPIPKEGGGYDWVYFDVFDDLEGRRYVGWNPSHGARNQGEELTAAQTDFNLRHLLERFAGGGRPVIDQFNFSDTTLQFASYNARLAEAEMEPFLELSRATIAELTDGYFLWATRDYRENLILNPSFQHGMDHWEGEATLDAARALAVLAPGAALVQKVDPKVMSHAGHEAHGDFTCDVEVEAPGAAIEAFIGETRLGGGRAAARRFHFDIPHDLMDWTVTDLRLVNAGRAPVSVRSVWLSGFVQRLGVRDEHGAAGPRHHGVQALNRALLERRVRS